MLLLHLQLLLSALSRFLILQSCLLALLLQTIRFNFSKSILADLFKGTQLLLALTLSSSLSLLLFHLSCKLPIPLFLLLLLLLLFENCLELLNCTVVLLGKFLQL